MLRAALGRNLAYTARHGPARSRRCGTASVDLFSLNHPPDQITKSSVRPEVEELEKLGPLPSEDEAEVAQLERIEELYRAIAKPITDDEASYWSSYSVLMAAMGLPPRSCI